MFNKLLNLSYQRTAIFVFLIVLGNVLVITIPFQFFFKAFLPDDISKNLSRTIHGLIITLLSLALIKTHCLGRVAGVRLFYIKKPLLLVIPFIFPMCLGWSNLLPWKINISPISLGIMIVAVLTKGLAEEICFRGLLQSYLVTKYRKNFSVSVMVHLSALIFALMHLINLHRLTYVDVINQVIAAYYFGVFFGAMLLLTKNVFALGIIHASINFVFLIGSLEPARNAANPTYINSFLDALKIIGLYAVIMCPLWIIGMIMLRKKHLVSLNL